MTERLYYRDSFLYNFDAEVRDVLDTSRPALVLDRTAFYPTSGGQIHDTGWITPAISTSNDAAKFRVTEVADTEDGHVVHYLEAPLKNVQPGARVHGEIDAGRRRDHMQQHSAQHILSAAFVRRFDMPTVSFHMAEDYCSIDLDAPALSQEQIESAERLANEIVLDNRGVDIRFVTRDEAASLGLRKIPPTGRDQLRLIDIRDFDLTACGGTHVSHTGEVGAILLRKSEKVRQGYRVEFVAGQRAVAAARRDFSTLTETAALFSAHIYDVPQQARKSLDEIKSLRKQREQSQDELATAQAAALLAETPQSNGRKLDRPHFRRPRPQLPQAAGPETNPPISRGHRPARCRIAPTRARLRPVRRAAARYGCAFEGNLVETRRTRRRQQRPCPGRCAAIHRPGGSSGRSRPKPHALTAYSQKQKPPQD